MKRLLKTLSKEGNKFSYATLAAHGAQAVVELQAFGSFSTLAPHVWHSSAQVLPQNFSYLSKMFYQNTTFQRNLGHNINGYKLSFVQNQHKLSLGFLHN